MSDTRIVICFVGGATLVLVGGIVYGAITQKAIDVACSTLAGTALGYLGGLLKNSTPAAPAAPTTVNVSEVKVVPSSPTPTPSQNTNQSNTPLT